MRQHILKVQYTTIRAFLYGVQGRYNRYAELLKLPKMELQIDRFECSFENNILTLTIYDIPPLYKKLPKSAYTDKWYSVVHRAIRSLPNPPRFEKAFIFFEFYIPAPALKTDSDNRMLKTIIDALVRENVIPDDDIHHMAFGACGKISNEQKTVITVFPVKDFDELKNTLLKTF